MENLCISVGEVGNLYIFKELAECIGAMEAIFEDWHGREDGGDQCGWQVCIRVQKSRCGQKKFFVVR